MPMFNRPLNRRGDSAWGNWIAFTIKMTIWEEFHDLSIADSPSPFNWAIGCPDWYTEHQP